MKKNEDNLTGSTRKDETLPKLIRCSDGMCGAYDCPRCHPACTEVEYCIECGRPFYTVYITDEDLCRFCLGFVCAECDMEQHEKHCGNAFTEGKTL